MSKKSRFTGSFDKEYGKRAQALLKSALKHLYHIHWSLPSQLSWKTSLWLTCEILGRLVNTLPTNEKYSLLKKENLTIPIQMQLSKKKTFSQFLVAFTKSRSHFKYLETKDDPHRFCILEITNCENVVK